MPAFFSWIRPVLWLALVWLGWWVFYTVCQIGFIAYQCPILENRAVATFWSIVSHGFWLNASMAAYCTLPAALLAIARQLGAGRWSYALHRGIVLTVGGLATLAECADYEIFRAWGAHFNAAHLIYLLHPAEAVASIQSAVPYAAFGMFFGVALAYLLMRRRVAKALRPLFMERTRLWTLAALATLAAGVALIIPIRGGLQLAPINQSSAYFSPWYNVNQAGVNASWDFLQSVGEAFADETAPYRVMEPAREQALVSVLTGAEDQRVDTGWVATKHPNVILIIWESGTAKVIGALGGLPGITPCFDSAVAEGALFTNIYAAGDRSEKGLLALLTGTPAQTQASLIKFASATERLPHLSTAYKKAGYSTAFIYGGELEFANIKSMLLNGSYDRLMGKQGFAPETWNSKWGAHDEVTLARLLATSDSAQAPFFNTLFTLSSHEPFEVPGQAYHPELGEEKLFLRSLHYTDSCLGVFLRQARRRPWWDSTLVCIVADHGHRMPRESPAYSAAKFHIPLLLTGGALRKHGFRDGRIASQIDVGPTLLALAGVAPYKPYVIARSMLAPRYRQRAFYTFYDGGGLITPHDTAIWDAAAHRPILTGNVTPNADTVQAFLQQAMGMMRR